ncbi:MAG: hypothetical protein COA77_00325 [Thaumarchaeota archaeon]|nr:MAG: hypothetical protein COA77_00325 [Nitrososphaerota archaeon]
MKFASLIIFSTIGLVGITLIISSFITLTSFSNEIEKTVSTELKTSISNAMDKIDRTMYARMTDIKSLTSKSNLNLVGNNYSIKEKMDYLRDYEKQSQAYTSSAIYDLTGIRIGDTRNLEIGLDESEESFFSEAIQGKIFHDPIPITSESLGISIIHFSGPLYDDNGNISGVLSLIFSISKINDILNQDAIHSKPIKLHLLSKDGLILYSSHHHQGIFTDIIQLPIFKNFLKSTDKSISFTELNDYGYESLFVVVKQQGFLQHKGDGWILSADIPTTILFEERDQFILEFIVFAVIILIIAIFASFIIAKRLTIPVKALENEMQHLSSPEYNIKEISGGSDEIESMSKSFQLMVNEIKKSQAKIKKQYTELKQIDIQKDEFSSMITHELKTPLTPIRGYCQMFVDGNFGTLTEEQVMYIKKINSSAIQLERLIGDILDAQKLDMNKMTFNKSTFDIDEFLKTLKQNSSYLLNGTRIELVVTASLNIPLITDYDRLGEVFDNLIRNSIDFISLEHGKIEVSAKQENGKIIFLVKDNGIGIPKEKQANIFKKFYQVDTSQTRKHGGSGLGLTICKGIIEGLGGKIWFESEPGKYTKFYFSIPLVT